MEFQYKLDLLGGGASEELACQSCAANPNASVVTHRANQPIRAGEITTRPKDPKCFHRVTRLDGHSRRKTLGVLNTGATLCQPCATP